MFKVVKRNGEIADFNLEKIKNAIGKAFDATGRATNEDILDLLVLRVTSDFQTKISDGLINVEDVQDSVEKILEQSGYNAIAKAYILYRKQREKMRNLKSVILDYKDVVSGAITSSYWLSEIYDEEIADAHRKEVIYINDLYMLTGYSNSWSLKRILSEGLAGVNGNISSSPARHLSTICNQIVNFMGIIQNEWVGPQTFASFDTYLAAFVKSDNLSYEDVKQCMQSFIFGVNTPTRWGARVPACSITLDWDVPESLAEEEAIVAGIEAGFKYKDCKKEMDMINKAYLEIMLEGDAKGAKLKNPIPTYKNPDALKGENSGLLAKMKEKYGERNFLENINSIGLVTIDVSKLANASQNKDEFYKKLDKSMELAARSLKIKRDVLTKLLHEGMYPYTERYLGKYDNHYSTISYIGFEEMKKMAKWIDEDLKEEVLEFMKERVSGYNEKYGELYNLCQYR